MSNESDPEIRNLEFVTTTGSSYRVELYIGNGHIPSGYSIVRFRGSGRTSLPNSICVSPEIYKEFKEGYDALSKRLQGRLDERSLITLIRQYKPRCLELFAELLQRVDTDTIVNPGPDYHFVNLEFDRIPDLLKSTEIEEVRDIDEVGTRAKPK